MGFFQVSTYLAFNAPHDISLNSLKHDLNYGSIIMIGVQKKPVKIGCRLASVERLRYRTVQQHNNNTNKSSTKTVSTKQCVDL